MLQAALLSLLLLSLQPGGVNVTTDSASYAQGDQVQVSIENNSTDRITRGGIVCDDVWPLALEQLDADGNWQPVAVPQHACIGIAAALIAPGQTQTRTLTLPLDPGTYHLVYAYTDVDTSSQELAISDPFDVTP